MFVVKYKGVILIDRAIMNEKIREDFVYSILNNKGMKTGLYYFQHSTVCRAFSG